MAVVKQARKSITSKKPTAKKAKASKPTKADLIAAAVDEAKEVCSGVGAEKRDAICAKLDRINEIAKGK